MNVICYQPGEPTETGVYACRVEDDLSLSTLHRDTFLFWFEGKWWYMFSDQRYRAKVHGWIGPLARTKEPK